MNQTVSDRILVTPSAYTKTHYLYVQETGSLKSLEPHISHREKLDSFLFFIVAEGCGTLTLRNETSVIKAGDCVLINCQDSYSHESSGSSPWSLEWVHFSGVEAKNYYQLYQEMSGSAIFTPSTLSPYLEILHSLYQSQRQKNALTDLLSHNLLTNLITRIFEDSFQKVAGEAVEKLGNIRNYIEEHYADKITLDLLSEIFFISKYHLVREYQRLFGVTIMNDLTIKRLSHAKSMLRFSTYSVEDIALSCGFQTSSYFIKVFKRYESITPLEYRGKW